MPGTVTRTDKSVGDNLHRVTLAWTSDAFGDVSANKIVDFPSGEIRQVKFVPDATAVPTAAYDVLLKDDDGADLLQAEGDNLSETTAKYSVLANRVVHDSDRDSETAQKIDLVVAAAGNAKKGKVILWLGPVS